MAIGSIISLSVLVININIGEVVEFVFILIASKFIGKHYSCITKCKKKMACIKVKSLSYL